MREGGENFAFLPLGIAEALVVRKQTTIKEQKETQREPGDAERSASPAAWPGCRCVGYRWEVGPLAALSLA